TRNAAHALDAVLPLELRQQIRAVWIVRIERADTGGPVRTDLGAVADITVVEAVEARGLDQAGGTHTMRGRRGTKVAECSVYARRSQRIVNRRITLLVRGVNMSVRVDDQHGDSDFCGVFGQ